MPLISRLMTIGSLVAFTFPISVIATAQENSPIDTSGYRSSLESCTPSSHRIPSLLSAFGIEVINRAHIQGYEEGNCVVDFTFATFQEPDVEASYVVCAFTPETVEEMLAAEADETVSLAEDGIDISDQCVTNDTWDEELDLQI